MQAFIKYLAVLLLSLSLQYAMAQDSIPKTGNHLKIERLKKLKSQIEVEEKTHLKAEVEAINIRLEKGELSREEAQALKMKMAKKRALNIENRTVIIDNKIALLERNEEGYNIDNKEETDKAGVSIGGEEGSFIGIEIKHKKKTRKFDRRTKSNFVLGFGLNNAIIEGESLDDSPYKIGGSRFFEIGWAWKTRIFKNSNFARFKYGLSFQVNGLKPDGNRYFVKNGNQTVLETFPENLKKSKLTLSNLVFPIHFELGPSKKIEKDTYFRYSTKHQLKFGIGGYAGFNIGTRQKLKYKADGGRVKDKQKSSLNTSSFVYGLSTYVAIGDTALYLKYDISPIFKNQITDQNNISVGVRFDMD